MRGRPTFRASSPATRMRLDTRVVSGGWGGMMYHTFIAAAPHVLAAGPLLSTIDFWLNLPDQRQFIYMADEAAVRQAARTRGAVVLRAVRACRSSVQG